MKTEKIEDPKSVMKRNGWKAPNRMQSLITLGAGGISIGLGLTALVGWHIHSAFLIQTLPIFSPIPYHTALGFLFCGIALLSVELDRPAWAIPCGLLVTLIGLLTLLEYLLDVEPSFAPFLVKDYARFQISHTGRMVLNTALCFTLSGVVLLLMSKPKKLREFPLLFGLLGAVISALGGTALFCFALRATIASQWGPFTSTAVPTAIGFTLLGIGILAFGSRRGTIRTRDRERWLPLLVAVGVATVTLGLWLTLKDRERDYLNSLVQSETLHTENEIAERIGEHTKALIRMAKRWEGPALPARKEWEADAGLYLKDHPAFQVIERVDPSLIVRWVAPLKGNEMVEGLYSGFDSDQRFTLEKARDERKVALSHSFDLVKGGKGFLICAPIFQKDRFDGFVVGILRIQELLDMIFEENLILEDYSVAVFDGEKKIYSHSIVGRSYDKNWGQETEADFYEIAWRIEIRPAAALIAQTKSFLSEIVLILGFLMAWLLAWAVHLAQTAGLRAREIEVMNRELQDEIVERQRAERGLRQAHDELDRRVQERTRELGVSNDKLETANKRLEELSALKDDFVATVSHELRTPLTSIKEGVSLLSDGILGSLSREQFNFLKIVGDNIERLTGLIENMLDLSKIESGRLPTQRRRTSIQKLIETTLQNYKPIIGSRTLKTHFSKTPDVFADPNRMIQVFGNLISNAIKFTPEKGTLRIATETREGFAAISFEDNGAGIAKEDLPKLFRKFSQVGNQGDRPRGTGLGLAVSKELVELQRGRIEVQSELERGSKFTVLLPFYSGTFALNECFRELTETPSFKEGKPIGLITFEMNFPGEANGWREKLEAVTEEIRRHMKQGDHVLVLEPSWVILLTVADSDGVKAIVHRMEDLIPKKERSFFQTALYPADGTGAMALFEHATRIMKETGPLQR